MIHRLGPAKQPIEGERDCGQSETANSSWRRRGRTRHAPGSAADRRHDAVRLAAPAPRPRVTAFSASESRRTDRPTARSVAFEMTGFGHDTQHPGLEVRRRHEPYQHGVHVEAPDGDVASEQEASPVNAA